LLTCHFFAQMRTRRTVWVADPGGGGLGGGADRLVKRKRVVMGARPTLFTCLRCRQDKVCMCVCRAVNPTLAPSSSSRVLRKYSHGTPVRGPQPQH
jgi:hypothetical protein